MFEKEVAALAQCASQGETDSEVARSARKSRTRDPSVKLA